MSLVTVDEVRDTLGDAIADRADIDLLIDAASEAIEKYCRRTFAEAEIVETLDGSGTSRVVLARPPVSVVDSVDLDGSALDNTGGLAWTLDPISGLLHRGSSTAPGCWTQGVQNVEVTYTGGYAEIPAPVRWSALLWIQDTVRALGTGENLKRRRLGDAEVEFFETSGGSSSIAALPRTVQAMLNPYRLVRAF